MKQQQVSSVDLSDSAANRQKRTQLHQAWALLLAAVQQRGFHGTAALEISVQDGTIQHYRKRIEQVER